MAWHRRVFIKGSEARYSIQCAVNSWGFKSSFPRCQFSAPDDIPPIRIRNWNIRTSCYTDKAADDLSSPCAVSARTDFSSPLSLIVLSLAPEKKKNLRSATVLFSLKAKCKTVQQQSYDPGRDARNVVLKFQREDGPSVQRAPLTCSRSACVSAALCARVSLSLPHSLPLSLSLHPLCDKQGSTWSLSSTVWGVSLLFCSQGHLIAK